MQKQPIDRSALLVIDVQNSFKVSPRWERRGNPDFESNVSALVGAWREASLPVVFVLHTDEDEGFQTTSRHFRLMDFLTHSDGDSLLIKNTRNAFTSTDLQPRLEALGVKRLVITGIQTEQCCETTARLAADLGYDVDFVTEATQTFPIMNEENGEELSTDEIFRRTEFVLRKRFARIATVRDLVTEAAQVLTPSNR